MAPGRSAPNGGRTEDRDTATSWATREAQYAAVCTWGIPDHAKLQRLSCLKMPVFVANGDSDPMIRPYYSLPACWPNPAGTREDLRRLGARVPSNTTRTSPLTSRHS